jgi:hypothetical protein
MDIKEVLLEDELSEDDLEELEEHDLEFEDLKESLEKQEEQEEQEEQKEQEQEQEQQPNKSVDYYKIFSEFINDILNTFPEYTQVVSRWWTSDADEETRLKETENLINHCKRVFPERFFDILYKNEKMFSLENNDVSTEFLPGILFKHLWNLDISENTKEIIWKYLQLVLFSVIGNVHSDGDFKDTAKLFEFIDENELKQKLEETFSNMNDVFSNAFNTSGESNSNVDASFNMPNVEEINEHINSMLGGKLGKLAMELAEETANELSEDLTEEETDSKKVFEKLFKNPTKMMSIIKNIGSKLDEKIKSGEINESELMSEGAELLQKLKNTGGMADIQKMFSQFNIPGLSKGSKVNVNAMESQLNKNIKHAKMKERIKAKLEAKHAKQELEKLLQTQQQQQTQQTSQPLTDEELVKFFRSGDKPDKTPRVPKNKKNKNK